MIFKLHYWCLTAGANAMSLLMGVFLQNYTDASPSEIGALFMVLNFMGVLFRPIICSISDREHAHQKYLIICQLVTAISYTPFVIIPFLGPAVYREHARACWYLLVALKVIGDIAFGGVISIGDALAINYSKRVGTDFSVYRIWGTFSWMFFGVVTGHINEVSFLPKYVPAFFILIGSTLIDMFLIWLWPKEYFVIVPSSQITQESDQKLSGKDAIMKSLLPREVVWAHAKARLLSLLCLGSAQTTKTQVKDANKLPVAIKAIEDSSEKQTGADCCGPKVDCVAKLREIQRRPEESIKNEADEEEEKPINKMTQLRIVMLLLKRDPRIIFYLLFFITGGASFIGLSFFIISLSDICHQPGEPCNLSTLTGFLQVSMAGAETVLFIYIKRIKDKLGRVNSCALALAMIATKYTFYGTIWPHVNPHYSLLSEMLQGASFGIYLTLMVELGHFFANEVEYILPELIERGMVKKDSNVNRLRTSVAATMQALIGSFFDGFGRGLGALCFGIILESYSFVELSLMIGISLSILCLIALSFSLFDHIFDPQLGLDVKARRNKEMKNGCNTIGWCEQQQQLEKSRQEEKPAA